MWSLSVLVGVSLILLMNIHRIEAKPPTPQSNSPERDDVLYQLSEDENAFLDIVGNTSSEGTQALRPLDPECVVSQDCSTTLACIGQKCQSPCIGTWCGINAECEVINHNPVCYCPGHLVGYPLFHCKAVDTQALRPLDPECVVSQDCSTTLACLGQKCQSPCIGTWCGINAECEVMNHNPVCYCPGHLVGDPFIHCKAGGPVGEIGPTPPNYPIVVTAYTKPPPDPIVGVTTPRSSTPTPPRPPLLPVLPQVVIGCENNDECPLDNSCVNKLCLDVCNPGLCGYNADCQTMNHRPVCTCPPGSTGDPTFKCSALLIDISTHIGCESNDQCPIDHTCVNTFCQDICHPRICGENADCVTKGNRPSCVCPSGTTGNPSLKCTVLQTEEPTILPPISGPPLRVDDSIVTPGKLPTKPSLVPIGVTTHRPPTPTTPGAHLLPPVLSQVPIGCESNDECPFDSSCVNKLCLDVCHPGICREYAECKSLVHRPVCTCPPGTTGDPNVKCFSLLFETPPLLPGPVGATTPSPPDSPVMPEGISDPPGLIF